ncbi:MAG: substrate-binding domain-containing protein [Synergistaceae bacterium]|nr:substrate-binding domain-containing protein [Synergistaceae bacterium]
MKKIFALAVTIAALLTVTIAVSGIGEAAPAKTYHIGMSQCNLGEPWRVAMNDQIRTAAAQYPEFEVSFSDAAQDNSKQIADVENFITQQVDLLIISPNEATPLTDVVKRAYDAGIPVIVLDRRVDGDAYTSFIGGDNVLIGKKAGEYVAKNYPNGCNIVEIKGLEGATPQKERHDGFMAGVGSDPKYKFVYSQSCDWLRDKAITVMESALQANDKIDVVYGHNDPAAVGAYVAAENAGRQKEMIFIGIDGLPTPDGGIREVMAGRMAVTYVYPTGGAEAIDAAYRLLVKGEKLDREVVLDTIEITKDNAEEMLKKFGGA